MICGRIPPKIRVLVGCRVEEVPGNLMPNPTGKKRRIGERLVGAFIAATGHKNGEYCLISMVRNKKSIQSL